jgi:hypothetical protein
MWTSDSPAAIKNWQRRIVVLVGLASKAVSSVSAGDRLNDSSVFYQLQLTSFTRPSGDHQRLASVSEQ